MFLFLFLLNIKDACHVIAGIYTYQGFTLSRTHVWTLKMDESEKRAGSKKEQKCSGNKFTCFTENNCVSHKRTFFYLPLEKWRSVASHPHCIQRDGMRNVEDTNTGVGWAGKFSSYCHSAILCASHPPTT